MLSTLRAIVYTAAIRNRTMEVRFVIETCFILLLQMLANKIQIIRKTAGKSNTLHFSECRKSPWMKFTRARFPPQPGQNTPVVFRITHPD